MRLPTKDLDPKYILRDIAYETEWKNIQTQIFIPRAKNPKNGPWIPDPIFHIGFQFSFILGSTYIGGEDFLRIMEILQKLNEQSFVMKDITYYHPHGFSGGIKRNSLIYPTDITLKEFIPSIPEDLSGRNYVYEHFPEEYLMFGKRTDWGIYRSFNSDMVIIGFKDDAMNYFKGQFEESLKEIKEWASFYAQGESYSNFEASLLKNYPPSNS